MGILPEARLKFDLHCGKTIRTLYTDLLATGNNNNNNNGNSLSASGGGDNEKGFNYLFSADVISCNGIIHVVDNVILPGSTGFGGTVGYGGGAVGSGYYGGGQSSTWSYHGGGKGVIQQHRGSSYYGGGKGGIVQHASYY